MNRSCVTSGLEENNEVVTQKSPLSTANVDQKVDGMGVQQSESSVVADADLDQRDEDNPTSVKLGLTPVGKVKGFDDLLHFAFYTTLMKYRTSSVDDGSNCIGEYLIEAAWYLLKHCPWDPFKQSLLAIILMESDGPEAQNMIAKVLLPLEESYCAAFGNSFEDKFGASFFQEDGEKVAVTRQYAIAIINEMIHITRQNGTGSSGRL